MTNQVPEPQSLKADTEYVVLEQDASGYWTVARVSVTARDAIAAVKAAVGGAVTAEGANFVAIPARSWKPVRVKAKIETTVVIEDAL